MVGGRWDKTGTRKNLMSNPNPSRRSFLKTSALAGIGASLVGLGRAGTGQVAAPGPSSIGNLALADLDRVPPRADGQSPVHRLTTKPLERVRVAVIGLHRGMSHVSACLGIEFADVIAVCDIFDDRAQAAAEACAKQRGRRPAVYSGSDAI